MPRASPTTFRQALFVAVTARLGYGFDSYAVNIYGLVLPEIKRMLHITEAQAGYIGSIFLLGYTIGNIGFGFCGRQVEAENDARCVDPAVRLDDRLGPTHNQHRRIHRAAIPDRRGRRPRTRGRSAIHRRSLAGEDPRDWRWRRYLFAFLAGLRFRAGVALALVPRFGWQSAFVVAIVAAIVLFVIRRDITESHRYLEVRANGTARPRLWRLPGVRRRLVTGWLIYTANAVGLLGYDAVLLAATQSPPRPSSGGPSCITGFRHRTWHWSVCGC